MRTFAIIYKNKAFQYHSHNRMYNLFMTLSIHNKSEIILNFSILQNKVQVVKFLLVKIHHYFCQMSKLAILYYFFIGNTTWQTNTF